MGMKPRVCKSCKGTGNVVYETWNFCGCPVGKRALDEHMSNCTFGITATDGDESFTVTALDSPLTTE